MHAHRQLVGTFRLMLHLLRKGFPSSRWLILALPSPLPAHFLLPLPDNDNDTPNAAPPPAISTSDAEHDPDYGAPFSTSYGHRPISPAPSTSKARRVAAKMIQRADSASASGAVLEGDELERKLRARSRKGKAS
ncbi:hypothetical protein H0H92_015420 [Tricholoma furcatifolium]|nr:hypothetical protein H0H92_015420 [Tricholoma furcatifolium]